MITQEDIESMGNLAARTNRLIDYLEGDQYDLLVKALNGNLDGGIGLRYKWKKRGYMPTTKNIVTPIVEKSAGNLFVKPPVYNILPDSAITAQPAPDARLEEIFNSSDFLSELQNINVYSRALKSIVILLQKHFEGDRLTVEGNYQFDASMGDALLVTILHQGNSIVRTNPQRTKVTELAYITCGNVASGDYEWRYIDSDVIVDYKVKQGQQLDADTIVNPNPDGIVPAVLHYDTKKVSTGVWVTPSDDLRTCQEAVNIHMTDLNYAIARNPGKPLYTNAKLKKNKDDGSQVIGKINAQDNVVPDQREDGWSKIEEGVGGIGSIVQLDAGADSLFVEHKGPEVDLLGQYQVIENIINSMATDWSVNVKVAGSGTASSGFQLIVEELDNLNLQEQRKLQFTGTFRRLYDILKVMYPELTAGTLQVEFNPIALPVNQKEEEDIWVAKIEAGLSSPIEYLMKTEGLTREEAIVRKTQLDLDNETFGKKQPVPVVNNVIQSNNAVSDQLPPEQV